ncbi:MAG: hypothetical protein JZU70_06470 [Chlorobium sp.]|nr:hypothetical protein [Chlorobium sp.]
MFLKPGFVQKALSSDVWGKVTPPTSTTPFSGLTTAQKAIVANFVKPASGTPYASLTVGQKAVVDAYANPANYVKPVAGTLYQNLNAAQKAVVDKYGVIDMTVVNAITTSNPNAWTLDFNTLYNSISLNTWGALYSSTAMVGKWGSVTPPAADTVFANLTFDQKGRAVEFIRPAYGTAYQNLTTAQKSVVDSAVTVSDYFKPTTGTLFSALTKPQKAVVANYFRPVAHTTYATLTSIQQKVVNANISFLPASGTAYDKLTPSQQAIVSENIRPSDTAWYKELTTAQKSVVVAFINEMQQKNSDTDTTNDMPITYYNFNAPVGKQRVSSFTEGIVTDYQNSNIYWGSSSSDAPASTTTFANLTLAQKKNVAAALGYTVYENGIWYNASASENLRLVTTFASNSATVADYNIDSIDWGGVRKPADNATFEELTIDQRAIVVEQLGYAAYSKEVFYKPSATDAAKKIVLTFEQGVGKDYQNTTVDWGTVAKPSDSTSFTNLTYEQQERVLLKLGYSRWNGVVYYKADAPAGSKYKLTFVQGSGKDYENSKIVWSDVAIPAATTSFDDMTAEQQFRILDQIGFTQYKQTVYYKSVDGVSSLKTSFIEGIDYHNTLLDTSATQTNRWYLHDGMGNEYIAYAYDAENDGKVDSLRILEKPVLFGQRGFGFLLTGSITTLQDNADFVVATDEDVIVQGIIKLLGADSNLALQSDKWIYWEAEAEVTGDITFKGGFSNETTLKNIGGANESGTSLYVGATSTLVTTTAGTSINLYGGQDVELHGPIVAGGTIGANGITWSGPDSTIYAEAGQQILVDTTLAATKSVTLETTGLLSNDDKGNAVIISGAGRLSVTGLTSDDSAIILKDVPINGALQNISLDGGLVAINALGNVTIAGTILSGGQVHNVVDSETNTSKNVITWSDKKSAIYLNAEGQLYLGGNALNQSGEEVEIGATIQANEYIILKGGTSSDDIGLRMPGGTRIATSNPDSTLIIDSTQDALVYGQLVAGGEVIDHYDGREYTLGSTLNTFNGDSTISITADGQIRLARDLVAGKTIYVRGGKGSGIATDEDPWADEGIVLGGNVHLKTLQENSTLTLSTSGDMSVLAPAWTEELVADSFAEFAKGDISADASFILTITLGTNNSVSNQVTVEQSATNNNTSLGSLVADLQAAIDTLFTGIPALAFTVRHSDGKLLLTSNYKFSIAAVTGAGGNAELLGFTQLRAIKPTTGAKLSSRGYALDAGEQGSVVNIGDPNVMSGEITISGWVRGYSAINMYVKSDPDGNQKLNLTSTGVLETLSGGMVLNPVGRAVIEGDLIARGTNADIIINAKDTLLLKGDLVAQRNIIINAGTQEESGEVSLETYGTSHFTSLDAGGRIVLTGLNDVVINSTIGKDNSTYPDSPQDLALLQISSTKGKLFVEQESGWLETGAKLVLSGQDVDLAGVVRSSNATPETYDNEVTITATRDIELHGDLSLAGSILAQAARNISIYNTGLLVEATGQHLKLDAGGDITIGGALSDVKLQASSSANIITVSDGAGTADIEFSATINNWFVNEAAATNSNFERSISLKDVAVVSGVTYSVIIDGVAFSYTALAGNTIGDIATNIASSITSYSSIDYTATISTADPSLINITKSAGTAVISFSASFGTATISNASTDDVSEDRTISLSNIVVLPDAVYTITIKGVGFSYRTTSGDVLTDIVKGLVKKLTASGGAVLEADTALDINAKGTLTINSGAQLYSEADNSQINLNANSIVVAGDVLAGSTYAASTNASAWTGKQAVLNVKATRSVVLGNTLFGGNLLATGSVKVQAGSSVEGLGIVMSNASAIKADATGTFATTMVWSEADAGGDGKVELIADGDIQIRGAVIGADVGADVSITSRSQVWVGGLVSADDALTVTGGRDTSKIGVFVNTLVVSGMGKYISGGTLDTAVDGSIVINATDAVQIQGVVGQVDTTPSLGGNKVQSLTINSISSDVTVFRNVDAREEIIISGSNISMLSGSHVYAEAIDSKIFIQARNQLVIAGSSVPVSKTNAVISAAGSQVNDDRVVTLSGIALDGVTYNLTIGEYLVQLQAL